MAGASVRGSRLVGVPQSVGEELAATLQQRFPGSTATYVGTVPGREASLSSWPEWTLPSLREYFFEQGISAPFSHQVATAEAAWAGRDVVVATGTSSGKSLGYLLPVLTALADDATGTALYLTPTKALGSDQWARLDRICRAVPELRGVVPSPYDGDTPTEARRAIRDNSRLLLTNPDMVHAALCGAHARFARILRHVRFIVIDECHTYRGVFGAHVAIVIRRLLRIAARYGAHPTIILASATAFDPAAHAQRLTGRPARVAHDRVVGAGIPRGRGGRTRRPGASRRHDGGRGHHGNAHRRGRPHADLRAFAARRGGGEPARAVNACPGGPVCGREAGGGVPRGLPGGGSPRIGGRA